ncbi:protein asteroid homolog 1-like [Salmo salar]|uniref:Protein asteroid homolog 1-like n=1 Tax=Salmo salar TaxID=8030 RepID=A0ABM3D183_SALSA|nr:protein asteroid homolog 1-like [Salmo salar]|eukprot:XP_014039886.1 PREDICTED: protein asteroid homolog 1-like [Salmo salar]
MGVSGLTSFIDDHGTFLTDYHFRNSKLVIDGSNLYHSLYFKSRLDQKHGGDYDDFEDQVCKFFKALRDCGIEPYVIIDGGSDFSDKKFETLLYRVQSTLNKANNLSKGLWGSGLLPILIKQVFKQVLSSLKVPFAQCIFEADQEIASLAERWNCPVLSYDSDFYIFDIQAGYLPISHFKWQNASTQRWSSQNYIPCKRYTTTSFCRHFKINRQLLPVFAAITGNDYVNLDKMGFPIRWEDKLPMEPNRRPRVVFFNKLLNWLASFQEQQEALDNVPRLIVSRNNQHNMDAALQALSLSIETYQLQPGCLEQFFIKDKAPDPGHLPDHLSVLPDWTLLPLMKGILPSSIIYILQLRPVIQGVQVEDPSLASGNNTSRPIRQVVFGLLLGERREVEEYDREGINLTSSMVKAILPRAAQQMQLDMLNQAPHSVRLEVFLETLGVSQSTLNGIPPHLGLPVAVTYYWLRHAHLRPDHPFLQALLLGLVYGELCRQRKSQTGFIEEGPVLERLRGLIQRGASNLDLAVAHAYSQWQRCMRDGLDLNQLLCFPLPEPQIAWLYKGTLVHQLVDELRGVVTPDSLLMEDPSSGQLYRAMLEAILNSQETEATGQPDGPSADSGAGGRRG